MTWCEFCSVEKFQKTSHMERWESLKNGAIIHNPGTDGTWNPNQQVISHHNARTFILSKHLSRLSGQTTHIMNINQSLTLT